MVQVRHQRFAGRQHLVRPRHQIVDQTQVAAQLVGQDVHRRLEDAGDGRDRARLAPQPVDLPGNDMKYCIMAMPPLRNDRLCSSVIGSPTRPDRFGDTRQPDVVQKAGRVLDQLIVLVRLHERVVLGRLEVLEAHVGRHVDTGHAVVPQADALGQAGPDVDHVGHDGIPVEVGGTLAGRVKRLRVVVRQFLAACSPHTSR